MEPTLDVVSTGFFNPMNPQLIQLRRTISVGEAIIVGSSTSHH